MNDSPRNKYEWRFIKLKSTLEDFREKSIKKGFNCGDNELREMDSIVKFLANNKKVSEQIINDAAKTIKIIQPGILFDDFEIAVNMIRAVVCNAIYCLVKDGYIEIKDKGVK